VIKALEPLGSEYCARSSRAARPLVRPLSEPGKQSGAFSCGTFDGDPYILMNYKPEVLDHVFTLAHEAGHSMHSTTRPAPAVPVLQLHDLRGRGGQHVQRATAAAPAAARPRRPPAGLPDQPRDRRIRATIVRQTMFAEFEKITHEMAEAGEPLTVQTFKDAYRKLLEQYFGPDFALDDELSLECFRIPHFYRAFYVYKYATGCRPRSRSASACSTAGKQELNDYLGFLKAAARKTRSTCCATPASTWDELEGLLARM
jgi:oligoendopeptidase F